MLINCHGSKTAAPLVHERAGDEGWEGNMIHWETAMRLIRQEGARPPRGGLAPPSVPSGYRVPRMSRWLVDWNVRQVVSTIPSNYALRVEEEFRYEFDRFFLTGHLDVNALNRDATDLHIKDWKTGRKPVTVAPDNWQIKSYLALLKRAYPQAQHARADLDQPWNVEEDGFPRVSTIELDGAGLDNLLSELNDSVNAALDDPFTTDSGLLQCAWCPVGIQCPSIQLEIEFLKAHLTPESLAAIHGSADDGLLGDIIISARTVRKSIEDAEQLIKDRIKATGSVTSSSGTVITAKQEGGHYTLVNPEGAFEAVKQLLPPDRIPKVLDYSMGRLVDEVAATTGLHKGGQDDLTAKSIVDLVMKPNFEQGTRIKLVFK